MKWTILFHDGPTSYYLSISDCGQDIILKVLREDEELSKVLSWDSQKEAGQYYKEFLRDLLPEVADMVKALPISIEPYHTGPMSEKEGTH